MFTNKLYNNVSKIGWVFFFTFDDAIKKIEGTLMTDFSIFLGYANMESNFAGKKVSEFFSDFNSQKVRVRH